MAPFILFDLDGTLTDPQEGITKCIQYALESEERSIPSQQALISFIGPPLQETFGALLQTTNPQIIDRATAKYRERFVEIGMFENRVYDGIPDVLSTLRAKGFHLVVATSKPQVYADQILTHFDLRKYFVGVFGPELDGSRRAKTELIHHLLVTLCLSPAQCLMVGDREHDIIGAHANRIAALAVAWGYGSADEHARAGADGRVELIADLVSACLEHHSSPPR